MSKERKTFNIEDRLIDFAVQIIRIGEFLPKTKVGNHVAGQIIRSGTSPALIMVKLKVLNLVLILSTR